MNFKLKPGIKLYYQFGECDALSDATITDERAVKFLTKYPHYIKYFEEVPQWYIEKQELKRNSYNINLGVIIPTLRDRPVFLKFCLDRLKRQSYKPYKVKIIDYLNNTDKADIAKRYKEGIRYLFDKGCDLVAMMEDDDYYPLTYLHELVEKWVDHNRPNIIGCRNTVYYHLPTRKWLEVSPNHSSAFCTAVSPRANIDVCGDYEAYYDLYLWMANKGVQVRFKKIPIGIKHGIGRCGGRGHQSDFWRNYKADYDGSQLKKWVDNEALQLYLNISPFELVNILTRTHNRPKMFKICRDSVTKQTYKLINHIVGSETCQSYYPEAIRLTPKTPDLNNTWIAPNGKKIKSYPAPYNKHLNQMALHVKRGWVMYLDDDDMFSGKDSVTQIVSQIDHHDQLLMWRVDINGHVVPSDGNFGQIIAGDISGIGFMFHSKHLPVKWPGHSVGDYKVISQLSEKLSTKWIDKVLTKTQGKPNNGRPGV